MATEHVSKVSGKLLYGRFGCFVCASKTVLQNLNPTFKGYLMQFLAVQDLVHAGRLFRSNSLIRRKRYVTFNDSSMFQAEESTCLANR
jgi:hypothetical protein